MSGNQGGWSFAGGNANYTISSGGVNDTLFSIQGLSNSTGITVDENEFAIHLGTGAFGGLSNKTTLTINGSDVYHFVIDDGLATEAKINSSSLSFTKTANSSVQTVQGKLEDYYKLNGNAVTYYTDSTFKDIAIISGLSDGATLDWGQTGSVSNIVKLDRNDFKTGTGVTLTASSLNGGSVEGSFASYDFSLQLLKDSSTVSSLGFDSLSNRWQTNNKTATYYSQTGEGWSLDSSGKTISNVASLASAIVTISGFRDSLKPLTDQENNQVISSNGSTNIISASGGASGITFYVYQAALPTLTGADNGLKLFTGAGASAGWTYEFKFVDAEKATLGGSSSVLGMSAGAPYWASLSGGGINYQFDTTQGWSISGGSVITYAKAKSSLPTTDAPTGIASIGGLQDNLNFTIDSIKGAISVAGDSARIFTFNNTNLFKAVTANSTDYSITVTDTNLDDSITSFTFALSTAIAQSAVADYSAPSLTSIGATNGTGTIAGKVKDYYSLSSDSAVISYHAATTGIFATITGLSTGATLDSIGSGSVIILDRNDLTDKDVTLSLANGIYGLSGYTLSFAGGSTTSVLSGTIGGVSVVDASATVSLGTGVAGLSMIYGLTEKYYSMSSNNAFIKYNAPEKKQLASIVGLSSTATVAGAVSVSGARTIALTEDALGKGQIKFNNIKVGDEKTHGLSFVLMEGNSAVTEIGFRDSGNYWNSIGGGSVIYQHHTLEGWKKTAPALISYTSAAVANPETFFTLTGLSSNVTAVDSDKNGTKDSITGITFAGTENQTVTIDTSILDKSQTVSIIGGTDYSFKLFGDDGKGLDAKADDNKYGFKVNDAYWSVSGSSAYYLQKTDEGWEYAGDSITYTAASTATLAVVEGLKSDNLETNLKFGLIAVNASASTFTINKDLFKTAADGVSVAITSGTGGYTLLLPSDYHTIGSASTTIGLQFTGGNVKVMETLETGWFGNGTSKVTYYTNPNTELASITGLDSDAQGNISLGGGSTDSLIVYITNEALTNKTVSLTNGGGYSYSLQLADSNYSLDADQRFGFDSVAPAWALSGTLAIYYASTTEGWALSGTSVINYTSASGTHTVRATINGLSNFSVDNNGSIAGVTVGGTSTAGIITLSKDVLGAASIALTDEAGDSITYSLSFAGGGTSTGFEPSVKYWTVNASGSAVYQQDTLEGWTLSNTSNISYTPLASQSFVKITGLNGLTPIADKYTSVIGGIDVSADGKTFSIGSDLLSSVTVAITALSGSGYSLAFGEATNKDGSFGFEPGANEFKFVGSSATYQHEIDEGWKLENSGHSIVYTPATSASATDTVVPDVLFTLTGLSSTASLTGNVSIGGTDSLTVYLDKGALVASSNVASLSLGSGKGYKLAVVDDKKDDKENTIGFERSANYWATSGGSAFYRYNTTGGWTVSENGMSIGYTTSITSDLAIISGFSSGLSASTDNHQINGIAVNTLDGGKAVFEISSMSLFTNIGHSQVIQVTPGEGIASNVYSLALTDDINQKSNVVNDSVSSKFGAFNNGSVSILGALKDYVTLADNKYSATYNTGKSDFVFASISGLATGSISNYVTLGADGTIMLGQSALAGKNIYLTENLGTADSLEGVTDYQFVLGENINQTANKLVSGYDASLATITGGKAVIKGTTEAYYTVDYDGNTVNYGASKQITIAEVTGLSAGTTAGITLGASGAILINATALAGADTISLVNKKVGDNTEYGFSLSLAGTSTNTYTAGSETYYWSTTKDTATYKLITPESWKLDKDTNTIVRTAADTIEVAKISGIALGSYAGKDSITIEDFQGFGISYVSNSGIGTFVIEDDTPYDGSLLGGADITVTKLNGEDDYTLSLTGSNSAAFNGGETNGAAYWSIKSGVAEYIYSMSASWTVNDDGNISYNAPAPKTYATIKGLKNIADTTTTISADSLTSSIGVSDKTFSLSTAVLGNNNIALTMGDGISGYGLSIMGGGSFVGGATSSAPTWVVARDGSVKYQLSTADKWQLQGSSGTFTSIEYTADNKYTSPTVFGSFTGLKSGITEYQLSGISNPIIEVVNSGKGFIVHGDALDTSKAGLEFAFTGLDTTYSASVGADVVQKQDPVRYWVVNGTTATYKEDTPAYYDATGYHTAVTGKVLATVTGLKKGIAAVSNNGRPASIEGIDVVGDVIRIADSALGTSTVSIKNSNGQSFTLAYDGTHTEAASTNGVGWVVSGGIATLKDLKPAYYAADTTGTKITYTAAKTASGGKVYATIKGLSKTATAADFESALNGWAVDSSTNLASGTITIKGNVLNKANVTMSIGAVNKKTHNLKLELDTDTVDNNGNVTHKGTVDEPQVSSASWSLNKTTATYKGNISEGYRASSDGKTITYTKNQTNATLLTISGLPKTGVICKNNKLYAADSDGNYSNTTPAITVAADGKVSVDGSLLALKPTKLTLKGAGYEFKTIGENEYLPKDPATGNVAGGVDNMQNRYDGTLIYTDSDKIITGGYSSGQSTISAGTDVWRISGTTATYERIIPDYYKLTNATTLTYVKEKVATEDKKQVVYGKITGLAKGLTLVDGGKTVNAADGTKDVLNTGYTGIIELKEAALGTSKVTFTKGTASTDYSIRLDGENTGTAPLINDKTVKVWAISGTTATLKNGTPSGWFKAEPNANTTTYTKQNAKQTGTDVLAKITGLKKGLKVEEGDIAGISPITDSTTTIQLDNRVLPTTGKAGTTKIVLTSDKYKLSTDISGDYAAANGEGESGYFWSVSGANVNIKSGTKAYWDNPEEGDAKDTTLVFQSAEAQNKTADLTIKGLKKGLKLNTSGEVDGIKVDWDAKIVTVDSRVLGTTNVTVSSGYKLKLADATITTGTGANAVTTANPYAVTESATKNVWSMSGTTAYLKKNTLAGYTLAADGSKITYTKAATGSTLATITGLKSGLKLENLTSSDTNYANYANKISGITVDHSTKKLTIDASALDNKNVALTSSTYSLALADTGDAIVTEADKTNNAIWTVNGTTAYLRKGYSAGYVLESGDKKITYYDGNKASTASSDLLLTITGLKRGLKVTNNHIAGIDDSALFDGTDGGLSLAATETLKLSSSVLGTTAVKVTKGSASATTYNFALADNVVTATPGYKYVVNKDGSVTVHDNYTPKGYTLGSGSTSITYSSTAKANGTAVAKIEGLLSGTKADANSQIAGISFGSVSSGTGASAIWTTTFWMDSSVLGTTDVTLTDLKSDDNKEFKFALGSDLNIVTPTTVSVSAVSNGIATISASSDKSGYSLGSDSTTIIYTPEETIKTYLKGGLTTNSGITVKGKTINIPYSNINGEVTVSEGDYTLNIINPKAETKWVGSGTTATLVQTAKKDEYLSYGNRIVKAEKAGTNSVLATITGLPEDFDKGGISTPNVDSNGDWIIGLSEAAFTDNTSDIKLTGAGYKLNFIDDTVKNKVTPTSTSEAWSVKEVSETKNKVTTTTTTATLAKGTKAGYTLSSDGKTMEYHSFVAGTPVAEITGLKAGVKLSEVSTFPTSAGEITLTKDMLGDSSVALSSKASTAGYKLKLDIDVPTKPEEAESEEQWSISGTTLTIKNVRGNYYTNNAAMNAITTKDADDITIAVITGLPKGTTLNAAGKVDGITLDETNSKVRIASDLLGTGTVKITSGNYKFDLADDVATPVDSDLKWTVKGTAATLTQDITEGQVLSADGKSIAYSKASNKTVATLKGLKSGLKETGGVIPEIDVENGVITISNDALGTSNVTLTNSNGGAYTLALAEDVDTKPEDTYSWEFKNQTATYKKAQPAHHELNANNMGTTYKAQGTATTLTTISNVTNFTEDLFDGENTVTLTTNNLTGVTAAKPLTITNGYQVAFGEGVNGPGVGDANWTQSGDTAVLKGNITSGYTLAEDGSKVTFTASQSNQAFASIKGALADFTADFNIKDKTVLVSGTQLEETGVAVSGDFEIQFNDYDDHTITGSAGADNIVVGSGMVVSLGGGDDYVDFNGDGNEFVYNSGDGKDTIADFTAGKDKIRITSGTIESAVYEDGDVVLKVGSGTITLKDFGADKITYYKGTTGTEKGTVDVNYDAADLLESDNFLGSDTELGSIVSDTGKLGDLEDTKALTDSNVTTLTKQSSLITFGNKK